jgi:sec-independent protein translocase protein TatC
VLCLFCRLSFLSFEFESRVLSLFYGLFSGISVRVSTQDDTMPLWQHLDQLRNVFVKCLIALFLGICITFHWSEVFVKFLQRPLLKILPPDQAHLYYTGIADKFLVYFKLSMLAAFILVSPYILYQVWKFVAPGLYKNERKLIIPFILLGTVAFIIGASFAYYLVIPYGYHFLINFGSPDDRPLITLTEYFRLTLKLLFAMGLIFEVPVVLVLLAKMGIVRSEFLSRYRRHAAVLVAVVSAIITPTPDAFTMILVMVPLYILYEISILGARWVEKT